MSYYTSAVKKSFNTIGEPLNWYQPEELEHEDYYKLTDKIFWSFRDLYKEHGDDLYDFYLKIDDDTYLHAANMEKYLKRYDPGSPNVFGYDLFAYNVTNGYQAGGSGYVMSKGAFRILGKQLNSNLTFCGNSGIEGLIY
jgi:glycoprotein-N-acetylgalactosamine 3-beta-galactosyltransferase